MGKTKCNLDVSNSLYCYYNLDPHQPPPNKHFLIKQIIMKLTQAEDTIDQKLLL